VWREGLLELPADSLKQEPVLEDEEIGGIVTAHLPVDIRSVPEM
jgi:hypothetical protein